MTELNVTVYFQDNDPYYLSNSVFNLGNNAGRITWNNALNATDNNLLNTPKLVEKAIKHFLEYGAWDRQELEELGQTGLEAMILQECASDLNNLDNEIDDRNSDLEAGDLLWERKDVFSEDYYDQWEEWLDNHSGRTYLDDDGQIWYHLGI